MAMGSTPRFLSQIESYIASLKSGGSRDQSDQLNQLFTQLEDNHASLATAEAWEQVRKAASTYVESGSTIIDGLANSESLEIFARSHFQRLYRTMTGNTADEVPYAAATDIEEPSRSVACEADDSEVAELEWHLSSNSKTDRIILRYLITNQFPRASELLTLTEAFNHRVAELGAGEADERQTQRSHFIAVAALLRDTTYTSTLLETAKQYKRDWLSRKIDPDDPDAGTESLTSLAKIDLRLARILKHLQNDMAPPADSALEYSPDEPIFCQNLPKQPLSGHKAKRAMVYCLTHGDQRSRCNEAKSYWMFSSADLAKNVLQTACEKGMVEAVQGICSYTALFPNALAPNRLNIIAEVHCEGLKNTRALQRNRDIQQCHQILLRTCIEMGMDRDAFTAVSSKTKPEAPPSPWRASKRTPGSGIGPSTPLMG